MWEVQGYYFNCQLASPFTQIILHDGRQCIARQRCTLPSVRIYMIALNGWLLHTIFMLEIFSFGIVNNNQTQLLPLARRQGSY